MVLRSEADIRAIYADLLEDEDDDPLMRVAQVLDAGYGLKRAPADLHSRVPRRLPEVGSTTLHGDTARRREMLGEQGSTASRLSMPRTIARRSTVRALCLGAITVVLVTAASVTLARPTPPDVTKLGSPTNAVPLYHQALAFHRVPVSLHQGGKPVMLFMGTLADGHSAAERWPLVKALALFGTFTRVKPALQSCSSKVLARPTPTRLSPEPMPGEREPCGPPTFDLVHGSYHSRYVAFTEKDLLDQSDHLYLNRLSPLERTIYAHYARTTYYLREQDNIWGSITSLNGSIQPTTHHLPLLLVGNQLQTGNLDTIEGDFTIVRVLSPGAFTHYDPTLIPYLSFETVRTGLLHNSLPTPAKGTQYPDSLLFDVNADTNVIAALICHADGKRPAGVCNRPAIETILKHLK